MPALYGNYYAHVTMKIKPILDHPDYLISNYGDIFSKKYGKFKKLKKLIDRDGYVLVVLRTDNKSFTKKVHRLVLMMFDRMPSTGEECRHLDDNKINNHISNLNWSSHMVNMKDIKYLTGDANCNTKFTDKKVSELRKLHATGQYTQRYLSNKFGMSEGNVSLIINNKSR